MYEQFQDRVLTCAECRQEFIFTAGEQLFFFDKQFKNDPKRCKLCKGKRAGASAAAGHGAPGTLAAAGISRTETRTQCSECGIETTVPFKPTQGRPVLCRGCFQTKSRAVAGVVPAASMQAQANVLTGVDGRLSPEAALQAAAAMSVAAMSAAAGNSSVATPGDLAAIAQLPEFNQAAPADSLPTVLARTRLQVVLQPETKPQELLQPGMHTASA